VILRLNVANNLTSAVHGIAVIRLKTQQSEIMRRSFVLPLVFLGLAGCVAVSAASGHYNHCGARGRGSGGGYRARSNRAEPGTGLCSGGRAALKSMFATMVWRRTDRLVPVCDEL